MAFSYELAKDQQFYACILFQKEGNNESCDLHYAEGIVDT
jgi:hypothetical protein